MKAVFMERHGPPEVLKFGEMPDPAAKPGEIVVDIVAASVNGADWKVREGKSESAFAFPVCSGAGFLRRRCRGRGRGCGLPCRR